MTQYEPIASATVAITVLSGIVYETAGPLWAAAVPLTAFALWRLAVAVARATKAEWDDKFLDALKGGDADD